VLVDAATAELQHETLERGDDPGTGGGIEEKRLVGRATKTSTRNAYWITQAIRADWRCRLAKRRNLTSPTTSDV
jgi:hypothetical protein